MNRKEDVMKSYLAIPRCSYYPPNIQEEIRNAVGYGFDMGVSFGKQVKYAEQVTTKCLIQPENDRAWKEELSEIKGKLGTNNYECQLLALIAEILLIRKNGG